SDSDPSEDSLPPVPELPLVSPFLYYDDSEVDSEFERHESLAVHDTMVLEWRDRIASRLAWRRVSHHSSDHHSLPDSSSSSSSSDPSSVHSSTCDSSGQAHSGPSTRDVPSRLIYPPVLTPRYSSSSERSLDSSLPSSRPSRKRCRPPTASDTVDAKVVIDVGISEGVVAHIGDGVGMRVKIDVREDDEEFEAEASAADTREIAIDPLAIGDSSKSSRGGIPDLEDTIYDIVHYMSEEEFHQVRRDSDDTRRRLRRLESYVERHLGFRP
ncbi:hypothetical protein Tco_1240337, partial [Tanacetum coccineum]